MIQSIIQGGRAEGMRSMDDSLLEQVERRKVSAAEAYRKAMDKNHFAPLVQKEKERAEWEASRRAGGEAGASSADA
jgi:Tfp pilus assembly ATPase PilU